MSVGGELAFVALHGVVKFLDTVFWVFGKGVIATALAVAGLVAPGMPPATPLTAPTAEPPRLFAPPFATPSIGVQQSFAPRPTSF